jgi:hypothetical protein
MTRSNPEPDPGARPDSSTSDEMNDNSLEAVASKPPTGLRHSQLIRQSKGNPSFAKKVNGKKLFFNFVIV